MNKSLIIGGGIVSLLILAGGVYFFTRGNNLDDLIAEKDKIQVDLALAENKLKKEKETLSTMTNNLRTSFPLAVNIQDQIKEATDIVRQTDFLFVDPYGSNPKILVKNLLAGILINDKRKNINALLLEWQKKTDILSIKKIDIAESEKIKNEAQIIKSFITDLHQIIESLTPVNSGLSQFQIDTYSSQLPPVASIDEIIASIEVAIENSISNSAQTPPSSGSSIPPVTPDAVVVQQTVVVQAEAQVVVLQEQIKEVEVQIQQSSPTPAPIPDPTPTPTPPTTSTPTPTPTPTNTNNPTNPHSPVVNSPGIIIQPGAPQLIQGTDPY